MTKAKKKPSRKPLAKVNGQKAMTLADLTSDPANCRRHNPRNVGAIVNSLHAVGAARSIVIDENNVILAGNGLVEAAGEAGIENVRVIEASGNEVIAVRRTGLTPKQKAQLAIADNRTTDLSTFDAEQLLATIEEYDLDLASIEFTQDELDALAKSDESTGSAGEPPVDQAINERYEVVVECGSETEQREVFEKLQAEGRKCRVLTV